MFENEAFIKILIPAGLRENRFAFRRKAGTGSQDLF